MTNKSLFWLNVLCALANLFVVIDGFNVFNLVVMFVNIFAAYILYQPKGVNQ